MKSTSESLSPPETSNGRAAGGNCVVARRGGEQPEADLRSQTQVNPIRFTAAASLLAKGEACRVSGNRLPSHPSSTGERRAVVDGWGENAGKVSCGSVESCPGRKPRERCRAAVRAAIVAVKRGNARGAKGGRKWNRGRKQTPSNQCHRLPQWLERHGKTASGELNRTAMWRTSSGNHAEYSWPQGASPSRHPVKKPARVEPANCHDWRAVCGRSARTVRREGWGNPMPHPYLYPWRGHSARRHLSAWCHPSHRENKIEVMCPEHDAHTRGSVG